jgi:hypothetical protein
MMEPSFAKLSGLPAQDDVAFIIVAGIAVTLHGHVRLTETVDLLVQSAPQPRAMTARFEKLWRRIRR